MGSITTGDGATIEYEVTGSGSPLVLVHGITESRRSWDPLVPGLVDAGYRVVAVDLRGHGASSPAPAYDLASMAADAEAVISAEGLDDPLLVGHSLGGAVVSALAAVARCRAVVNVDQALALGAFAAVLGELEEALRAGQDQCEAVMVSMFDAMKGPLPDAEDARLRALRRPVQEVVLGVWDLILGSTEDELNEVVEQVAQGITAPYLALHGIDPGPDYASWLTGLVPSAEVEVWPAHGHYPHLVDPARFVARVVAFDPAR